MDTVIEMTFDESDKCMECCRNIHEFWAGQDGRMTLAENYFEEYDAGKPTENAMLAFCALKCVFEAAIAANCTDLKDFVYDVLGKEGWPMTLEAYGITLDWRQEQPEFADMNIFDAVFPDE